MRCYSRRMKTRGGFRYALDPVCLAACLAYALNRWWWKPDAGPGFMHDHFNDVLLIPAGLPLVLWLQRALGVRKMDAPPTFSEVALHALVWALIAEGIGPWLVHHGTADWRDVAAYLVGAAGGYILWRIKNPLASRREGS